jgi:hypothetical protein
MPAMKHIPVIMMLVTPVSCLNFQVFLCFGNSVASTRFMLQDEFNIQTTRCDNCIIVCSLSPSLSKTHVICAYLQSVNMFPLPFQCFMFCLQQIACIFSIVAMIVGSGEIQEASQLLSCLAELVYCT